MESANLLEFAFFVLIASCIESSILAFCSCLRHFAANDKLLADDHELGMLEKDQHMCIMHTSRNMWSTVFTRAEHVGLNTQPLSNPKDPFQNRR